MKTHFGGLGTLFGREWDPVGKVGISDFFA